MTNSTKPSWSAVWAMSLCAMVLIAAEFLPVSLLTPMAADLAITEGQAGQTIAISGFFALLTSLLLTSVIGNTDRRYLLLFFTALLALSAALVALSSNVFLILCGRALLGICIGGFWSMSAAVVMRLVPENAIPKALAILNGGNALAMTIAAPLGSFLGGIIGWRGAFFCIVPIALSAFIWQCYSVPSLPSQPVRLQQKSANNVFMLLTRWPVVLGMLSVLLFFIGQFALFTYLRPFLEIVTGVNVGQLSLLLLVMGFCGLIGTLVVGRLLKNRLYSILIATPFFMMLTALALILLGASSVATFMLIALWGFFATAAPVAWWTWLSKTLPDSAEAGGGLMVAVIQLAITLGAATGGWVFDAYGIASSFSLSAVILFSASLMAFITWKRVTQKDAHAQPAHA
ncbi:MFS transporter [Cellvibrio sp. QJXJ]|uniref:MFS transporter n=1 Tax=Cellvibrio sp. QJXJ TaxID=2964606 RepID=UPI0021C33623|nr:MFS transporter [Cellvibrio sp. QJXJ]UUA72435.1 MFS transporter [Cellvibrio sp. QJXJ]